MKTKKLKLVIDRAKWQRGSIYGDEAYLLDPESKKMCCLGFLSRACGLGPKTIQGLDCPATSELNTKAKEKLMKNPYSSWLFDEDGDFDTAQSDDCVKAINFNDRNVTESFTERDREKRIKTLFAKHNISVTFKGKNDAKRISGMQIRTDPE